MALSVMKNANLALTFLLELGVLSALGYWGFQTGQGTLARFALGLGTPVVAIALWGLFGAPRGRWHLRGVWRGLLQIIFFGSAALALALAVNIGLGIAWAVICIANIALNHVWKQNDNPPANTGAKVYPR